MKTPSPFTAAVHGSLTASERAGVGAALVDLGVNTSPYGPCPSLLEAARDARLDLYPDQYAEGVREAWGEALGRSAESIAFGAGGAELIWAACRAFLGPNCGLMILGPTFSEPAECARAMGAPHFTVDAGVPAADSEPGACPWTVEEILAAKEQCPFPIGLVYVCSPNNPTGTTVSPERVAQIAAAMAPARVLYDRSFETVRIGTHDVVRPVPRAADFFRVASAHGVLELRSFTKDFSVPGLRLGALFGVEKDIGRCLGQMPPWSVSSMAAAVAHALLKPASLSFLAASREHWWNDASELWSALAKRGFKPLPSSVPFALLHVGDGAAFRQMLLERQVHVRDCASFGLPEYVRLCARGLDAHARLLEAMNPT